MKENNSIDEEIKSKTQVKKELLEITKVGEQLIAQSTTVLSRLPLNNEIKNAILDAKKMKKIALKRQIGYIGKLLRNSNFDEINAAWQIIQAENQLGNQRFKQIEAVRDKLINDQTKQALEAFFNQYPLADRQLIRQLVKRARIEINENKESKKAYRELFQAIKNVIEKETSE
ncbi:MAG: DUF615 domain-containing protein [Gammaproteobacteria bacterium]|nr:MAG: DUF615 domain-containing protein [Gammaproteobacteria bacterium]UTW42137.1 DUF615 domain-containing protein [bacterium SCSIO 12844]